MEVRLSYWQGLNTLDFYTVHGSAKITFYISIFIQLLQEIIAQIMSVEAIIARARSLKAKFGVEKCENEEEKEDLQR